MLRRLARIALAALLSVSAPANAQGPSVTFRVLLFPNAQNVPPDGTAHSGMLAYPDPVRGKANVYLSVSPSATGLEAGASFAVSAGGLPDGMDLDAGTGTISGFPAVAGSYSGITVTATDSTGATVSNVFSFSIVQAGLSYPAATAATVGQAISIAPSPQNLESPFYVRTSGSFPPGVDVDASTGVVSGTPTAAGTYAGIVVYGAGSDGASAASNGFAITVSPASQAATASMPSPISGQVGQPLSAYGSTSLASATWSVTAGTLPQGLDLDAATGEVRGSPASAGTTSGLRLTAAAGGQSAQTNAFSIVVQAAPVPTATASMQSPVNGQVGQLLSASPTSSGFQSQPSWALSAGTLPAGLTVNSATGEVRGTPTAAGTTAGLRLTATAGPQSAQTGAFSIVVAAAPVPASSAAMATPVEGRVGEALFAAPTSSGFQSAPTWTVSAGTLPSWAAIDPSTGAISGMPTAVGTTSGLRLTATAGAQFSQTNAFSIVVTAAPVQATASMATPVPGTVGQSLSVAPTSAGFASSPSWTLTSGTLPPGLVLTASTGRISGTPTAQGVTSGLVLTAVAGSQSAQTNAFSIEVAAAPAASALAIDYPVKSAMRGEPAVLAPSVSGAVGTVTYAVSGTLPAGMTFSTVTGEFSGTPSAAGSYPSIRVTATDSQKSVQTPVLTLTVNNPSATGPGNLTGYGGSPFSSPAPTTTISNPTWALVAGNVLPSGLALDPSTGVISGTIQPGAASATNLALRATNPAGLSPTTSYFNISVVNASAPGSGTFTQGSFGSYTFTAPGLGGTVTWSVGGGTSLPGGLTLSPGGVLSGTPTGKGQQPSFTIVGTSSNGSVVTRPVTLAVTPYFVEGQPGGWTVGQFRSDTILSFRGAAPYPNPWTFQIVNGESLPPGVYMGNQYAGGYTGTPWQAGTYGGFFVRATNGTTGQVIDSDPLTITVAPAPGAPLALVQPEDAVIVRPRGVASYLVAAIDPADGLVLKSGDTLLVRPALRAGPDGLINGWTGGINMAPWGPTVDMNTNGSRYETGQSLNRYGSISSRAVYTVAGIYPGLTFMASDTNGGTLQSGRTGRVGFIGPYTLKVFDVETVAPILSSGGLPTSLSPASGSAVLAPGQSGDMDFNSTVLGYHVMVNCTAGQSAGYSVYSLLPDGTWIRIMTKPSRVCPSGSNQYYEDLVSGQGGIGRKFRVVVESGQLAWRGGRIGSGGAVYAP